MSLPELMLTARHPSVSSIDDDSRALISRSMTMSEPGKILALWSTPRSRSTSFAKMMAQRGDHNVIVEPFESSAYRSAQKVVWRYEESNVEFNYDRVFGRLVASLRQAPLFIKDHAYYINHLATPEFLDSFTHSFIIRHPRDALPSGHDKWPDKSLKEVGYLEQAELFDKVVRHTGVIPPVVDADDLVQAPQAITQAYCERVGITFVPQALSWDENPNERSIWHQQLAKTTGFVSTESRYVAIEDDERLKFLYTVCLPPYERLYRHRIKV